MSRQRARLNGILLAVAGALGLGILLLPDPPGGPPPPAVALDPAAVERIEVRFPRGGETLRLERGPEGWRMLAPRERPASDGRLARLLESLREPTRSCYPAAEHEPEAFGLNPPRAVLALDGTTIALGDRAADGRRYLRTGGRLCLVDDVALPMLLGGIDSLAPVDDEGT